MPAEMSHLSTEFVWTPIAPAPGTDLTGGTAEVAVVSGPSAEPNDEAWIEATLVPSGPSWHARILVGPFGGDVEPAVGDHQVWLRLTAPGSPERPVRRAGVLTIQ